MSRIRIAWVSTMAVFALTGCANSPHITRIQTLDETAETPYKKVLVLALFESFNARYTLERKIVHDLAGDNESAVAATSMMRTTTPLNHETIVALVEESGADALLVIQLVSDDDLKLKLKSRNPQSSYKVMPTYYFNVWDVSLHEYMEPQYIEAKLSLVLMTDLFSVETQQRVWAIESKAKIVKDQSRPDYHPFATAEAATIVEYLKSDGAVQ